MRIRKNRRITPLLFPNASADGKPQPYNCSLNQSVWDVISVSPEKSRASPPLHLLQQTEVGDDESRSRGNGIRSLHDDIIEGEESSAVMKKHEVIPIQDSDDESTESDNQIELEKSFALTENGRVTTRANNLLIGWSRGRALFGDGYTNRSRHRRSSIEHSNKAKIMTRRNRSRTSITTDIVPMTSSNNTRKHVSPLSPRASRAKKINNNDDFYYYSGIGPRRNKKRYKKTTTLEHVNKITTKGRSATEKPTATRKRKIEKGTNNNRIDMGGHSFVSNTNVVTSNNRIDMGHSFVSNTNVVVPDVAGYDQARRAPSLPSSPILSSSPVPSLSSLVPCSTSDSRYNNVASSRYGIQDYSNMIRWVCIDESDKNDSDDDKGVKDSDRDYSDSEVKKKKRKRKGD